MKLHQLALGLLAALALAGCTAEIDKAAGGPRPMPNWAVRGGGAFKDQSSTVFYGVGIANPMPNIALQRTVAEQRARVDIAQTLQTSMRSMVNDFMAHNANLFDPNGKASSPEVISSVSKGVSDAELDNCRIIDSWADEKAGTLYALARLDLNDGFYGSYKENLIHALRQNGMTKGMSDADADMTAVNKAIEDQRSREEGLLGVSQTVAAMQADAPAGAQALPPLAGVAPATQPAAAAEAQPMSPSSQAK
jgi:hypothetical protein